MVTIAEGFRKDISPQTRAQFERDLTSSNPAARRNAQLALGAAPPGFSSAFGGSESSSSRSSNIPEVLQPKPPQTIFQPQQQQQQPSSKTIESQRKALDSRIKSKEQFLGEQIIREQEKEQFTKPGAFRESPIGFTGFLLRGGFSKFKNGILPLERSISTKKSILQDFGTKGKRAEQIGATQILAESFQKKTQKEITKKLEAQAERYKQTEEKRLNKKIELNIKNIQKRIDQGEISLTQGQAELEAFKIGLQKFSTGREVSITRQLQHSGKLQIKTAEKEVMPKFISEGLKVKGLDEESIVAPISKGVVAKLRKISRKSAKVDQEVILPTKFRMLTPTTRVLTGAAKDPLGVGKSVVIGAAVTTIATPLLVAGGGVALTAGVIGVGLGGVAVYTGSKEIMAQATTELKWEKGGELGIKFLGFMGGAKLALRPSLLLTGKGRAKLATQKVKTNLDKVIFEIEPPLIESKLSLKSDVKLISEGVAEQTIGKKVQQQTKVKFPGPDQGVIKFTGKGKGVSLTGVIEKGKQIAISTTKIIGKEFHVIEMTGKKPGTIIQKVLRNGKLISKKTIKGEKLSVGKFLEPQIAKQKSFAGLIEGEFPFLKEMEMVKKVSVDVGIPKVRRKLFTSVKQPTAVLKEEIFTTREAKVTEPLLHKEAEKVLDLDVGAVKLEPTGLTVGKTRLEFVDYPAKATDVIFKESLKSPKVTAETPALIKIAQKSESKAKIELSFPKVGSKVSGLLSKSLIKSQEGIKKLIKLPAEVKEKKVRDLAINKIVKKIDQQNNIQLQKTSVAKLEPVADLKIQTRKIQRIRQKVKQKLDFDYQRATVTKSSFKTPALIKTLAAQTLKNLSKQRQLSKQKLSPQLELNQRIGVMLDQKLISDLKLSQMQIPITGLALTQLKLLKLPSLRTNFRTDFTYPRIIPRIPFALPFNFGGAGARGFGRRGRPVKDVLRHSEDFTSKILGLKAMTVTNKQLNKLIRKSYTGLEIRRKVVVI